MPDSNALDDLEQAVRQTPHAPEPLFELCVAYLEARDSRAASLVEDLLVRFPAAAAGWDRIGHTLHRAGKPDAALVCIERALRVAPTAERYILAGMILRELNRLAEGRAAFQAAVGAAPGVARAWFGLGLCEQDMGDLNGAAHSYERASMLDPRLAEAHVNLGTVLQERGDLADAEGAYARALAIRPDTFGRIAQALTGAPTGELWLDLGRLRDSLRR